MGRVIKRLQAWFCSPTSPTPFHHSPNPPAGNVRQFTSKQPRAHKNRLSQGPAQECPGSLSLHPDQGPGSGGLHPPENHPRPAGAALCSQARCLGWHGWLLHLLSCLHHQHSPRNISLQGSIRARASHGCEDVKVQGERSGGRRCMGRGKALARGGTAASICPLKSPPTRGMTNQLLGAR